MPHETLQHDALHRLLAVSCELGASADLEQILSVIIDAMRDLLDADRATVFEYDAENEELFSTVAHGLAGTEGDIGALDEAIRFSTSKGIAGESAREQCIINVPDAQSDPRFNRTIDRKTGFTTRSLLTIPLAADDGELVGVAQVLNKRDGSFTEDDEAIAAALAAQAAVAMRRGRLIEDRLVREKLERDLELARHIQQSSFPEHLPILDGFEIEAWNEPAEQTGGDTYDVIGLRSDGTAPTIVAKGRADRAVLLVADATGHGIGPALTVAELRSMLRMAVRMNGDLIDIAGHINRQLNEDLPTGRFITAWLAELDTVTATLSSLSCGQGPLLHYIAAKDEVIELEVEAVPMGIMPDLGVTQGTRIALAPGDIFMASSDGFFEAMTAQREKFETHRIIDVMRRSRDASAAEIVAALRRAVDAFTGGLPADDDRTVIVLKRKA